MESIAQVVCLGGLVVTVTLGAGLLIRGLLAILVGVLGGRAEREQFRNE